MNVVGSRENDEHYVSSIVVSCPEMTLCSASLLSASHIVIFLYEQLRHTNQ